MTVHHRPLLCVERRGLVQHSLGYADLPDVMEEGADLDRLELLACVAEASRESDGDRGDALRMSTRVVVLCLHASRESRDRVAMDFADLLGHLDQLLVRPA